MAKLLEKIQAQEASVPQPSRTQRKKTVLDLSSVNYGSKDKQISAKVNARVYDAFTQINKAQGLSNNSALNVLISKYVRENKGILDDEI